MAMAALTLVMAAAMICGTTTAGVAAAAVRCYPRFFIFGDSLSDTGNFYHYAKNAGQVARWPYGETFFHHPNGRYSDGRLIVDFIATELGMPFPTPYLAATSPEEFKYGANFAVASGTALSQHYFGRLGLSTTAITPFSLGTQIRWFKKLLPAIAPTAEERAEVMSRSLFLVGEIGENDYNHPVFQNRSLAEIRPSVPTVIKAIYASANDLIKLGAKVLVVPNIFPIGCVPKYLAKFITSPDSGVYNPDTGCIDYLNDFAKYHNTLLRQAMHKLRSLNPNVTIIEVDYYGITMNITTDPARYGFEKVIDACCGGGGPYNENLAVSCASPGYTVCPDPTKYLSWDGLHMTEAAYRTLADAVLHGPYASSPIFSHCTI